MDLFRNPVEDEQTLKILVRQVPNPIQRQRTILSSTKRESDKFGCNCRRSEDYTEHICGRSLPILHDQHWTNTAKTAISRGSDEFSFPTSTTIDKMDNAFGEKISSNSICNQCNVEIHSTEDHQVLVRSDINRHHRDQREISFSSTEPRSNEPVSSPTRRENGYFDGACSVLETRQLCRDESINSSSSLEERLANQTLFDLYGNRKRDITLRQLPHDFEIQYSHDIPSLLRILTSIYPFNETSSILLHDYEIKKFLELYGISNVHTILTSDDGYVFWLQNNAGTIYVWSRAEGCMSYCGKDLREALINYLFHQDNICYVMEFTHEIIPRNEVIQKAREFAESCEYITVEVPNTPLKGDGKGKEKKKEKKKKGQKKKNKH